MPVYIQRPPGARQRIYELARSVLTTAYSASVPFKNASYVEFQFLCIQATITGSDGVLNVQWEDGLSAIWWCQLIPLPTSSYAIINVSAVHDAISVTASAPAGVYSTVNVPGPAWPICSRDSYINIAFTQAIAETLTINKISLGMVVLQ